MFPSTQIPLLISREIMTSKYISEVCRQAIQRIFVIAMFIKIISVPPLMDIVILKHLIIKLSQEQDKRCDRKKNNPLKQHC